MAKQDSTPKQTSGGGFIFEDKVVAYFLVKMLSRSKPFQRLDGIIERIDTQRPVTEWHLDDLLITIKFRGRSHRLAFSIKSNEQITDKFPTDFIKDAWEQLLNELSDAFDEKRDFLGIITPPLDSNTGKNVNELIRLSIDQDPYDLALQIDLPNRTNNQIRRLHESAKCPAELAEKHDIGDINLSPGRILRRLVSLQFDFEDVESKDSATIKYICQNLLKSGTNEKAELLWNKLQIIARRIRRSAGYTDLPKLVGELRQHFDLKDFPDHSEDWEKINDFSDSETNRVKSKIGGIVELDQNRYIGTVNDALDANKSAILLGASGIGKTVIAKHTAKSYQNEGRVIWLGSEQLDSYSLSELRTYFGLNNSLSELLEAIPTSDAILVLDGLDKLHSQKGFATVSEILNACNFSDLNTPWKIIITCTPDEWMRVRQELIAYGISFPENTIISIEEPTLEDLNKVWETFPRLSKLKNRIHLSPFVLRPKVLDLLALATTDEEEISDIGEAFVVQLFWQRMLATGQKSISRISTVKTIAQYYADNLIQQLRISTIDTSIELNNPEILDELIKDRILTVNESRISFQHELYADWIRAYLLNDLHNDGKLTDYLKSQNRLESPTWHRALRIFGIILLEQNENISSWLGCFKSLGDLPEHLSTIAQDILLESTAFATAGGVGLLRRDLWEFLVDDEHQYLARLLNRLFHSVTFPNDIYVDFISRERPDLTTYVASQNRVPYWPYWVGIIIFLHEHRRDIPPILRGKVAKFIDLWLRSTPIEYPLRDQAAKIAVELGDAMLKEKEKNRRLFSKGSDEKLVYRSVISACSEEPVRGHQILLEASGRRDQRFLLLENDEEPNIKRTKKNPLPFVGGLSATKGPIPEPWKYGPKFRVDGALQELIFEESDALIPLFKSYPETAGEILLGLLISEPKQKRSYSDDLREQFGLEWPRWNPEFYTNGPFLNFLRISEDVAVSTIINLVAHATDRWLESYKKRAAREENKSLDEIEPPIIEVEINGEIHEYIGDHSVFRWLQYGPDKGHIIGTALTSLEKYLYDRADNEDDLEPLIEKLSSESNSLSIIGLLSVLGRRHPQYFLTALKGILASPYLLQWTITGSESDAWGNTHSFISRHDPEILANKFKEWHEMPHRKISLRNLAQFLFLNHQEFRTYLEQQRENWKEEIKPGGKYEKWEFIEHLIAQFDLDNFEVIQDKEEKRYYKYEAPESLLEKVEKQDSIIHRDVNFASLTIRCRQIIDRDESLNESDLEELWDSKQQIEEFTEIENTRYFANPASTLVAIASIFLLKGEAWLENDVEKAEWVRKTILNPVMELSNDRTSFLPDLDSNDFLSQSIPVLWKKNQHEKVIREAVAKIIFHENPDTVSKLTSNILEYSDALGYDHLRLIHAILFRAKYDYELQNLRSKKRFNSIGGKTDDSFDERIEDLETKLSNLEKEFIECTLETSLPTLAELAPLAATPKVQNYKGYKRSIAKRQIDEQLLVSAFKTIPNPQTDDSHWFDYWVKTLEQTLFPLFPDEINSFSEPDKTLSLWDRYLFERIAFILTQIDNIESRKQLWKPILDVVNSAPQWVEWFLKDWTRYALYPQASEVVVNTWIEMIEYSLNSKKWSTFTPGTISEYRLSELWRALFGFVGFGITRDTWNDELFPVANKMLPFIEEWSHIWLCNSKNVIHFALFLTYPASVDITLDGLTWLHSASSKYGKNFWRSIGSQENSDQAIFILLNHVWETRRSELKRNQKFFDAFRGLLAVQVSRQYPPAMELSQRVGSSKN